MCGKRLEVMLPVLERHGRLTLGKNERELILSVSAATIDRLLMDVKIAAAGGRRRRVGFYSAIRREVPIAPRAHADAVRHRAPPTRFGDAALVIGAESSVTFSVRQCAPFLGDRHRLYILLAMDTAFSPTCTKSR